MLRTTMLNAVIALSAMCIFTSPAHANEHGESPGQFENHKLIRVDLKTQRDLRMMLSIGAIPWACRVTLGLQDFSLSPTQLELLDRAGLPYVTLIENVQQLIDQEQEQLAQARAQLGAGWFDVYRTWPEVNAYIDELVDLRPDLVEKLTVGTSTEGRTIFAMRITGPDSDDKPGVLFNGCQHAREWISVMVPMYIADQLVRNYDSSPEIQSLMDRVEFFIVPIVNPDGYEFTYAPGGNRMWRKNRRVNGLGSFGVDLNRNWNIDWNGGNSTSTNPNSDIYVGPTPMSEPETQAMAQFVLDRPNIAAHIDFHNFSQLVLQPLAYTSTPPADFEIVDQLSVQMSQAIFDVHGINYPHGTAGQLLYFASGVFPDWSYDQRGILGYTIEVRPATSPPGFLLPPDEIIPTCEENFAAAMTMAQFVVEGVFFSFLDQTPEIVASGTETPLTVNIGSVVGITLDTTAAKVFSRIGDSGPFSDTTLAHLGGGNYQVVLPAIQCGESLQFYLQIESTNGTTYTSPDTAPESVYEVTAIDFIFADNFNDDLGWIAGVPDDDATGGHWVRDNPIGTSVSGQQAQPAGPYIGTACYITGQHPGGGAGANDVDNGKTTLISPTLDLSGVNDATINYWRWYSNHAGASPFNDVFVVDITNDDGESWVNVETVGPTGPQVMGGWYKHEFAVSQFVAPSANVRVRFVASDYDPQALVEAAVDAFLVTRIGCDPAPICPEDLTNDGVVDVSDLLALLGAWGPCNQPCPADINGDGTVDVSDLLLLFSAWGQCE